MEARMVADIGVELLRGFASDADVTPSTQT